MAQSSSYAMRARQCEVRHREDAPQPSATADRDEDFPGCESFPLPASEVDRYEGRLEFWGGVTEMAWKVCEPTSIQHEGPSRRLVRMAGRFAELRGSPIMSIGSADLVRREAVRQAGQRCVATGVAPEARRGRIQQPAGELRPFVRRCASAARLSNSDGVSHSINAPSTSSNPS